LAKLDERDHRVAREMLLGLRRKRNEPRIVMRKEREVRGRGVGHDQREAGVLRSKRAPLERFRLDAIELQRAAKSNWQRSRT